MTYKEFVDLFSNPDVMAHYKDFEMKINGEAVESVDVMARILPPSYIDIVWTKKEDNNDGQ